MRKALISLLGVALTLIVHAQPMRDIHSSSTFQISQQKISTNIVIDGQFNEPEWSAVAENTSFFLKFPTDEGKPARQTRVRALYNDKFIYFAITCEDSGTAFIQSLKRDIGHDGNDGIAIVIDALGQKSNGFFFVVNALNAQSEGLLNANTELDMSWDNKWFSATGKNEKGWTAEIAIPFKTLRYKADNMVWGINFVRIDTKANEYSVWAKVPVNFRSYDMGYTGQMIFPMPPSSARNNISLIPYVIGGVQSDKEQGVAAYSTANAGFDAKMALNSSLNLDLTVNPDFSQVEVDRQVTNLTRFNIFFPERRTFFLENADMFADYGYGGSRPFYSRRIGLDDNSSTIPIIGGARLTGNLGSKTRIGVMNIQTARKDAFAAQNYTAISLKQRVQKRSSVNSYFLNRQGFMTEDELRKSPMAKYGRNAGVEYNFTSESGKWSAWNAYHFSFKPGIAGDNLFASGGAQYSNRKLTLMQDFTTVGTDYYTDMGFMQRIENYDAARDTVVRLGYKHSFTNIQYAWFPEKGAVNRHQLYAENYAVLNPDNSFNELNQMVGYEMSFRNTSILAFQLTNSHVDLIYPISFTGGTPLPAAYYKYQGVLLQYSSDYRKSLSYSIAAGTGGFYNGTNHTVTATLTYRKQPHVNISLRSTYNRLSFPGTYGSTDLLLIAPQIEINFTTSIFWTTFIQYNNQRNNININSRFQWRFRPMSDLFLVYTDNYFTDPLFKNRSRGVVLKLNYWLNI